MRDGVVLITGATAGIGLHTARLLLSKGIPVIGFARHSKDLEFEVREVDVTDHERMAEQFAMIAQEHKILALVNNAGMGIGGALEQASVSSIERIVDVNLTAVAKLCHYILPYLSQGGRIVNLSSVGALAPLPYQAMYSATKAGVDVLSRALDNECKAKGVRVISVLPGDTKTEFTSARIVEGDNERALASIHKMERDEQKGASPDVVAKAIVRAITKKRPPLRIVVGGVSKLEDLLIRILPVKAVNKIIAMLYT